MVRGYSQALLQILQYKLLKVQRPILDQEQKILIATRTIVNILSMYAYWYALQYLALGVTTSIAFTGPFFSLFLGYLVLKETLKLSEIINMFTCFGGVLLIICFQKPQILQNLDKKALNFDAKTYVFSVILVISQALVGSCIYIILRKLRDVHYTVTNGIYGVSLSIFSTIVWYFGRKLQNPELQYNFDGQQITLILITAVFANLANQLPIQALQYDKIAGAGIIIICSSISMFLKYTSKDE
ncbi:aaa family atpase [Stylonychia lemnae]|uniref:Aaa family atpase n=1 Tax=Stylonychia lemnae TaxID=5949 RepID=A0A078AK07_STYLE|nr:aaa family atpase [Stylonychia lemnae]|eukprot:CDW82504.1 aaa family atpase [Stylonychia lemnae]